eukprot:7376705-Prymnesium_polylepis.1
MPCLAMPPCPLGLRRLCARVDHGCGQGHAQLPVVGPARRDCARAAGCGAHDPRAAGLGVDLRAHQFRVRVRKGSPAQPARPREGEQACGPFPQPALAEAHEEAQVHGADDRVGRRRRGGCGALARHQ